MLFQVSHLLKAKVVLQRRTKKTYRQTRAAIASLWENLSTLLTVNPTCRAVVTRKRRTLTDMKVRLIRHPVALISNWRRRRSKVRRLKATDLLVALKIRETPCIAWRAYKLTCRNSRSLSSTRSRIARVSDLRSSSWQCLRVVIWAQVTNSLTKIFMIWPKPYQVS